jgi:hypothetical protein
MLQGLIRSLFCFLGEERKEKNKRERERKKEAARGFFLRARGQTCLAGCAGQAFWLLGAIEG